eukprot:Cvel_19633.t2-p1 / transcript=Cvel_19633.t2 / gene=Cvel_19633 / organism=Chromera_velia_CCMP2878 / gene_product=Scytovirin, putative / transcript_product=Scytovirin, putative / location=Cvel_scaffold1709:21558-21809(-) / protein_length=84 / sequence_SO=supercontig / SO=protein_coding / is_pseudo=false
MRVCSEFGFCEGTARVAAAVEKKEEETVKQPGCVSPSYHFEEGPTGSVCVNDCQCDGMRVCSEFGFCEGTARVAAAVEKKEERR